MLPTFYFNSHVYWPIYVLYVQCAFQVLILYFYFFLPTNICPLLLIVINNQNSFILEIATYIIFLVVYREYTYIEMWFISFAGFSFFIFQEFRAKSREWDKQETLYQNHLVSLDAQRKLLSEKCNLFQVPCCCFYFQREIVPKTVPVWIVKSPFQKWLRGDHCKSGSKCLKRSVIKGFSDISTQNVYVL